MKGTLPHTHFVAIEEVLIIDRILDFWPYFKDISHGTSN